jgi:hypothetical protein
MPLVKPRLILTQINWEHHGESSQFSLIFSSHFFTVIGPTSWLSICSEPGIGWVSERTGVVDFAKSAKGLTLGWTRRLKLDYGATRERAPQIDAETAWGFSKGRKRRIAYS